MRSAIRDLTSDRVIYLCVTDNYKYPFVFNAIRDAAMSHQRQMPHRSQAHFHGWIDAVMVDVLRQCRYRQSKPSAALLG
jgi:hypothetical protein